MPGPGAGQWQSEPDFQNRRTYEVLAVPDDDIVHGNSFAFRPNVTHPDELTVFSRGRAGWDAV